MSSINSDFFSQNLSQELREAKDNIPPRNRERYDRMMSFLDIAPQILNAESSHLPEGTKPVILRLARRVMAAWLYKPDLDLHRFDPRLDKEIYDRFTTLPGIEIVQRMPLEEWSLDSTKDCAHWIFCELSWYSEEKDKLFGHFIDVAPILQRHFKFVSEPQRGDFVLYLFCSGGHLTRVAHYGKVENVDEDQVTVCSKFRHAHVFSHEQNLVPPLFGNVLIYLRP